MIPKKLHYCWFGGNEKPRHVIKCLETWRKICPDYEIKEWNESNFDVHINKYCSEAYAKKKWAFVSDVARVYALYNEGGIYMDTDVEVIRRFDDLLTNKAFMGFEGTKWIATSTMGTEPGLHYIKQFLDSYAERHFVDDEGHYDQTTNVRTITGLLVEDYGLLLNGKLQKLGIITVYPTDYFTPYDYLTGKLRKTKNTHTIHWFNQSWIGLKGWKVKLGQLIHRFKGIRME